MDLALVVGGAAGQHPAVDDDRLERRRGPLRRADPPAARRSGRRPGSSARHRRGASRRRRRDGRWSRRPRRARARRVRMASASQPAARRQSSAWAGSAEMLGIRRNAMVRREARLAGRIEVRFEGVRRGRSSGRSALLGLVVARHCRGHAGVGWAATRTPDPQRRSDPKWLSPRPPRHRHRHRHRRRPQLAEPSRGHRVARARDRRPARHRHHLAIVPLDGHGLDPLRGDPVATLGPLQARLTAPSRMVGDQDSAGACSSR